MYVSSTLLMSIYILLQLTNEPENHNKYFSHNKDTCQKCCFGFSNCTTRISKASKVSITTVCCCDSNSTSGEGSISDGSRPIV